MRNRTKSIPVVLCLLFVAGILLLSAPALAGVIPAGGSFEDKPVVPAQDNGLGLSPIAASGDWAAVQASGVLTVGTTASSPPFAYYTPGFQIDGFDAALMQAVADKLGVNLALVDYAFDGLPAALQVGQIDTIAAALTMTPERAAVVDFSMPYYLSAEAILAPTNSALQDVNLNTQDFTNLRLGVQRGTVYATWAKTHLIDMGRMPAANLQLFAREQDIVQALQQDRIDLGMMDLLPGQEYVRNGDATLVGSNQVLQQYAIAVRKGSSLLPQINLALTQLQQEGVLDKLHATYLAADEGTPQPTPTPVPVPTCQDVSGYVADLTFVDSDNNIPFVQPGQPFVKSWRLVNHGTCPWTKDYALVYVPLPDSRPEDQMGGVRVPLTAPVQPGQTVDLSASLVAPTTPGLYKGVWQMINAQGQPFGQRIWVRIQVPGGSVPTPAPTPTPIQGINFTVDRNNVRIGQCVNFKWDVTNVLAVFFYKDGQDFRKQGVAGQATRQECPQATTNYYLRVEKRDGTAVTPMITVYVARDPDAPYVQNFSSSPDKINTGQCSTLSWQVQGQLSNVKIKRNGSDWWNGAPATGSQQDCLKQAGDYNYALEATGPGGKAAGAAHVRVFDKPVPAPTATPFNPAPVPAVIDYFNLDSTQIMPDQCVNASWSVGAGVTSVTVLIDDYPVARDVPFVSSQQFCPSGSPGATLKFSLSAQGMAGTAADTRDVYVQVMQPAPAPTDTPEPLPTPAPEPPVIEDFSADSYDINAGECVNISWSVGGWVDVVQLYRDGQYLSDVAPNDGRQECLNDPGSYDYRLRAANSGGLEDSRDFSISVEFMPEPLPPDPEPEPEPGPLPEPDPDQPDSDNLGG